MEDKPVFDKAKTDLGIQMACEKMDSLGLTLFERWWVAHCIEVAARGLLGEALDRLVEKHSDDLGVETGSKPKTEAETA